MHTSARFGIQGASELQRNEFKATLVPPIMNLAVNIHCKGKCDILLLTDVNEWFDNECSEYVTLT